LKVRRILHSSANVAGVGDAAAAFYRNVLGLESSPRPDIPGVAGSWFRAGEAQIHLVDAAAAGRGIDPVGPHVCLGVDDLEAAVAELQDQGIEVFRAEAKEADGRGVTQVWVVDPAGNTIELQQDRPLQL
jgi:catechol 2,3-dioxygenase-like lactoylglutathione lyase family enzyme